VPNVGYARVSTIDQDPTLQLDALAAAGCAKVFEDCASGAQADRAGLRSALEYVRDGDVLIVWKLDRLGRSLPHLIEAVTSLATRGVGFRSITEAIDTTTPGGRLVFHLFGAFVDGCADPRISGAECLNWWDDNDRREALAERHVGDCWVGGDMSSGAMRRCGTCAADAVTSGGVAFRH
jgi:hypothetical protein